MAGKYNEILCGWIGLYVIPVTSAADTLSGEEMKQSEADQRFSDILLWFLLFAFAEQPTSPAFREFRTSTKSRAARQLRCAPEKSERHESQDHGEGNDGGNER